MKKSRLSLLLIFLGLFSTSCSQYRESAYGLILRAESALKNQEYINALVAYEKTLEKKISSNLRAKIFIKRGEIFENYLLNFNEASYEYLNITQGIFDLSWKIEAHRRLANLHFSELRDYKKSSFHYAQLSAFHPKLKHHNKYMLFFARSELELSHFSMAREILQQIPKEGAVIFWEGMSYFLEKKWDEAIKYWESHREKVQGAILVRLTFYLANALEYSEDLQKSYQYYYSIRNVYPNKELLSSRLKALSSRRAARKR